MKPAVYINHDEVQNEKKMRDNLHRNQILQAIEDEHQSRMDSLLITLKDKDKIKLMNEFTPVPKIKRIKP